MTAAAYTPTFYARRNLPADATFTTWPDIEPWFNALTARAINSARDLEEWLLDAGELFAAVNQEGVERYIAMTCQTDDPDRESAHLAWVRDIEPKLKPLQDAIRTRYLESPYRALLSREVYFVYDRAQANRAALYRAANIARETELAELEQQYQKIIGAMTVTFRGEERTPSQMAPLLEETDRATREEAWRLVSSRRLRDRDALDALFDNMATLRGAVAREADCANFVDYQYRSLGRFEYGVHDVAKFRDAIEQVVVPAARRFQERRRTLLKVDTLRPWDLDVDVHGRAPLRPFTDVDKLAAGAESIFDGVDPELGRQFAYMRKRGLLDLANRKGKAPGGYQTTLEDDRMPFIFMNAVGLDGDVRTLLHEGGHAFHALAARDRPLAAYREAPIEFCEVASMTMELLGARNLEAFYGPDDVERSYRELLEGIVLILPWIATVDAFQHWIYTHPAHSRDERAAAWTALLDRFGGIVDWTGLEDAKANSWHRQLHIFLYPFYYIEYGIAQLGALQIWRRALTDRPGAVAAYKRALALGGTKTLPELFDAADISFDFSAAAVAPLIETILQELEA